MDSEDIVDDSTFSGLEAETYWERRTVIAETIIMALAEILILKDTTLDAQAVLITQLMHEWDLAIKQLEACMAPSKQQYPH